MGLRRSGRGKLPRTARGPLVAEQFYRGIRAFGTGLVLLVLCPTVVHLRGEAWDAIGLVLFALILAGSLLFALRGGMPGFDTRVPVARALLERKHPSWALAGAASRGDLQRARSLLDSGVRADDTLPGGARCGRDPAGDSAGPGCPAPTRGHPEGIGAGAGRPHRRG